VHLGSPEIVASVAAFETCSKLITGPFGPNRVELSTPPTPGGGVKTPPALYRDWYSSGIRSGNSKEICSTYSALFYLPTGARKRVTDGAKADKARTCKLCQPTGAIHPLKFQQSAKGAIVIDQRSG
jgi:hypothetical protein